MGEDRTTVVACTVGHRDLTHPMPVSARCHTMRETRRHAMAEATRLCRVRVSERANAESANDDRRDGNALNVTRGLVTTADL